MAPTKVNFGSPTPITRVNYSGMKKFLAHFRRPEDYKGEYGFDWLRDEYIYPIETIIYDNVGPDKTVDTAPYLNIKDAICKNPEDLKNDYKTKDVINPISPYGIDYYPAWLSIFPEASRAHVSEVELDIEIEEIEPLVDDATEIVFESSNDSLVITPNRIVLSELLNDKQTKDLGTTTKDFYLTKKVVSIKSEGNGLENHEEIKIYGVLQGIKVEVGKLMVYKNRAIPLAEIIAVKVTYKQELVLNPTYQNDIRYKSMNQALINAKVIVEEEFRIEDLPKNDPEVIDFISKFIAPSQEEIWAHDPNDGGIYENLVTYSNKVNEFKNDLVHLYEKYGENGPNTYNLDAIGNYRTYLFYTSIAPVFTQAPLVQYRGITCAHFTETAGSQYYNVDWGNAVIVFGGVDFLNNYVAVHELAHSLSLTHSFEENIGGVPYIFYKGYTDNYMDYENLTEPDITLQTAENKFKGNMYSFFKWQWDIMRNDRSLVYGGSDSQ